MQNREQNEQISEKEEKRNFDKKKNIALTVVVVVFFLIYGLLYTINSKYVL